MSPDTDREDQYPLLRERFLNDPEFRARFRSDPVGTTEAEFGDLTDDERSRLRELATGSDDDLVAQLSGKVGSW